MVSGRPGGNPDIGNIAKRHATGPKSCMSEGDSMRKMMKNPLMVKKLKLSKGSKVLRKVRQCNFCPLRTKVIKKEINGKVTEITHYSTCPGYKPNNRKCIMPISDYVDKVRIYHNIIEEQDMMQLQKSLIAQSLMDAQASREFETMKTGKPGIGTTTFNEQALKYTNEMNKMTVGERHRYEVEGSVEVVETRKHDLSEEQLRKIADIMLEGKMKTVEVEGRAVDDREESKEAGGEDGNKSF